MSDQADLHDLPTLYDWLGSDFVVFSQLIETFYDHAVQDPLLAPLFRGMPQAHRENVSLWFMEVFGGPKRYSTERGSHHAMIVKHQQFRISEAQRKRWVLLMADADDEVGLPSDPEFRSAFTAYVEWGTRMALLFAQPGTPAPGELPMPAWGWGEAPPYLPSKKKG